MHANGFYGKDFHSGHVKSSYKFASVSSLSLNYLKKIKTIKNLVQKNKIIEIVTIGRSLGKK